MDIDPEDGAPEPAPEEANPDSTVGVMPIAREYVPASEGGMIEALLGLLLFFAVYAAAVLTLVGLSSLLPEGLARVVNFWLGIPMLIIMAVGVLPLTLRLMKLGRRKPWRKAEPQQPPEWFLVVETPSNDGVKHAREEYGREFPD